MLTVGIGSYGIACAACLTLVAMLSIRQIPRYGAIVGLAVAVCIWAALGLGVALGVGDLQPAFAVSDMLRSTAILLLVNQIWQRANDEIKGVRPDLVTVAILLFSSVVALGFGILFWSQHPAAEVWHLIGLTGLSIVGLFLVGILLGTSRSETVGLTKHLLIGAGTVHAVDFSFYTSTLFSLHSENTGHIIQPIVTSLAIPLFLISLRRLHDDTMDHPAAGNRGIGVPAVMASAISILLIAFIGDLTRALDWVWEPTSLLTLTCAAAMLLSAWLAATLLRHSGQHSVTRDSFAPDVDVRHEWVRLIETVTETPDPKRRDDPSLGQRALKAAAAFMDCDGGALFLRNDVGNFDFKTSWNIAVANRAPGRPPIALLTALSPAKPALIFDHMAPLPSELGDHPEIQDWLSAISDPWIILALVAGDEMAGLALITRPRRRRRLTSKELDLLKIIAHQLGSYLAVEASSRRAAENAYLARMSKHGTFVTNDLKGVIKPLSSALKQARDHGQNPAFLSDAFLTIGDTVERLKGLMQNIETDCGLTAVRPIDLRAVVETVIAEDRLERLALPSEQVVVDAEPTLCQDLLDHIIDNAWAAVDAKTARTTAERTSSRKAHLIVDELEPIRPRVSLILRKDDRDATLEVTDRGIGMTDSFVKEQLFNPLRSNRRTGISMYRCREAVERWQGRLEIVSEPAKGTTVRIILPLCGQQGVDTEISSHPSKAEPSRERAA